ncbi:MAG: MutS-related protein [Longimicrobiales bacterium]
MIPDALRVDNDVEVGPPGTFLLITGSNMSGKSTLLRAIGANAVLALAGAPVCARSMRLAVVSIRTSIRIADSVVRGVSYFMAQLQRMREIVVAAEQVAEGEPPVLYLLDEILQGTNTAERRIAATHVIRHLVDHGAIGAVTTHDLELADEPALRQAVAAVHFTETIVGGGPGAMMTFDYRLRPGVATSTNALRLMEMVGLKTRRDSAP